MKLQPGPIEEPGAYRIPEHVYHADPCPEPSLSSSLAKVLLEASPRHVWTAHPQLNPAWRRDPFNPRTALGSAVHKLLLGEGAEIECIPEDSYRRKVAQEARDAAIAAGMIPMLEPALVEAHKIAAWGREQMREKLGLDLAAAGQPEVTIAVQGGGWRRIRVDWIPDDEPILLNYKTIGGYAAPEAFARRAAQMDYDVQAAFYIRQATAAFPELAGRWRYLFAVQEIDPPYELAGYELSEGDRHVAERRVEAAEQLFDDCLAQYGRDPWPGYRSGWQRVEMPTWQTRRWLDQEEQAEGEGDWALADEVTRG